MDIKNRPQNLRIKVNTWKMDWKSVIQQRIMLKIKLELCSTLINP